MAAFEVKENSSLVHPQFLKRTFPFQVIPGTDEEGAWLGQIRGHSFQGIRREKDKNFVVHNFPK
jgi:hypothetical protein